MNKIHLKDDFLPFETYQEWPYLYHKFIAQRVILTEDKAMLFEITISIYLVMMGVIAWEDLRTRNESRFKA